MGGKKEEQEESGSTNRGYCFNTSYECCNTSANGNNCTNQVRMCNNSTNEGTCNNSYEAPAIPE